MLLARLFSQAAMKPLRRHSIAMERSFQGLCSDLSARPSRRSGRSSKRLHGAKTGERILHDLCKWMDTHGSLATLRHGFKCYGRTLRVAFFKAAHGLNPELEARYAANRLGSLGNCTSAPRTRSRST